MDLFERDAEVSRIKELLAAAHEGAGRIALLSAAAGGGKTTLLRRFSESATREGCLVLHASCARSEHAVPFATLGQLFDGPSLDERTSQRAAELLGEGHRSGPADGERPQGPAARVMQGLARILFDLSRSRTVVLSVDDVHHADPDSLVHLLHILRRSHSTRVMAMLTERSSCVGPRSTLHTELLRQPHAHALRLAPLSPRGVTEMIRTTAGPEAAHALGARYHALTGGNPSLVRALLHDLVDPERASSPGGAVLESAFEQTALSCLHSGDPLLLATARGIALLGESATPELLQRMLRASRETVDRVLRALAATGVLDGCRFRHPVVATAVLGDLPPGERDAGHRRAAELLYGTSAPATVVARHLLATGTAHEPWMVDTLLAAAETMLHQDQPESARSCLDLALRFSTGGRQRAVIQASVTEVEWRTSPSTAMRRVPPFMAALRAGQVPGRRALQLFESLLWHGQVDPPEDLPALLGTLVDSDEPGMDVEIEISRRILSGTYPQLSAESAGALKRMADHRPPHSAFATDTRLRALAGFDTVLAQGPEPSALAGAKQILSGSRLSEATFHPIATALSTLLHADQIREAEAWTEQLHNEAEVRGAVRWLGVLSSLRAAVALRLGNLPAAERHARAALTHLPPQAWGVGIGGPYATLVRALTEMGKYDEVASVLNEPVPEAMFGTPFGLRYLHARGHFWLARQQYHAALDDFVACGDLMDRWGLDQPLLVPWRSSAAEAWLRLGDKERARQLVEEQLSLLTPHDSAVRSTSLRLLALTRPLKERAHLLNKAVETLQRLGRKLELAEALADLGHTYQALGDTRRERIAVRRARHLMQECHASGVRNAVYLEFRGDGAAHGGDGSVGELAHLSEAERRVGGLAALGRTNREISSSLCITVSTVEQHLTRVYRKLNVKRRQDLPAGLRTLTPPPPAQRAAEPYEAGLAARPRGRVTAPAQRIG